MKQSITTIKRKVIIFDILSSICGRIGYVVDKVTGQAHYENIGTEIGSGSLGMLRMAKIMTLRLIVVMDCFIAVSFRQKIIHLPYLREAS